MRYNMTQIGEMTGFDGGSKWSSPEEVRAYFRPEVMLELFGEQACQDAELLAEFAEMVIENRWWCDFSEEKMEHSGDVE